MLASRLPRIGNIAGNTSAHYINETHYFLWWAQIAESVKPLAMGWRVRGSKSGTGEEHLFRQALGPPSLLYNDYRFSFKGVKRLGRGIYHPPESSVEIKERVELYLFSASGPSWPVHTSDKTAVPTPCSPSSSSIITTGWGCNYLKEKSYDEAIWIQRAPHSGDTFKFFVSFPQSDCKSESHALWK